MSRALSLQEDYIIMDDSVCNITERSSKIQQIEMKRQLTAMLNRIKLLAIQKQKQLSKQQQSQMKIEYLNNIRTQYLQHSSKLQEHKEIRNQSVQLSKEKKNKKKQDQLQLLKEIRQTIEQQKKQQFQQMKFQSLKYNEYITLQRQRSKSFNIDKKLKVQQYEQQQYQNLQQYKQLKQKKFQLQHKQVVLKNYQQKANDFIKLKELWELEKDILDSLISPNNSKINSQTKI